MPTKLIGLTGFAVIAVMVACGGTTKRTGRISGEPRTIATLAGARCDPGQCKCRDPENAMDQQETSPPSTGMKRYEVRIGPTTDPTWLKIDGVGTLFHGSELAEQACFYVDLASNQKHKVQLRSQAQTTGEGIRTAIAIAEHNAKGPWWYDSFEFRCGGDTPCSASGIKAWREGAAGLSSNLRDPCGSTKIRDIAYDVDAAQDEQNPGQIDLSFTLDIYPFTPKAGPGDERCAQRE